MEKTITVGDKDIVAKTLTASQIADLMAKMDGSRKATLAEMLMDSDVPIDAVLVSTGLYVLEEEILKYIPPDQYFDMTDLIRRCLKNGEQVGAYPVMDSAWLDMGEFSEMKKMAERMKL